MCRGGDYRTVSSKGAAFVSAVALDVASTNRVIELGIMLWMLMGWRFLRGALVIVAVIWRNFGREGKTLNQGWTTQEESR